MSFTTEPEPVTVKLKHSRASLANALEMVRKSLLTRQTTKKKQTKYNRNIQIKIDRIRKGENKSFFFSIKNFF